MKLLTFILQYFQNRKQNKVRRTNRAWLDERRQDVLESITDEVNPLSSKPYVTGGSYQWYVERPVELDFFFPEVTLDHKHYTPLAIKITGPHYRPYDQVGEYTVGRKFWEAETEADSFIVDVCQRAEIPLLLITPNDPIDPYSLAIKVRSLITPK